MIWPAPRWPAPGVRRPGQRRRTDDRAADGPAGRPASAAVGRPAEGRPVEPVELFTCSAARPLRAVTFGSDGHAALARANVEWGAGALGRRDRLPGDGVRKIGAGSHRRRIDDVRAGEFRALPAQDFQCGIHRGRRPDAAVLVRHDSCNPCEELRRGVVRLPGQCCRDRGFHRGQIFCRSPHASIRGGHRSRSIS